MMGDGIIKKKVLQILITLKIYVREILVLFAVEKCHIWIKLRYKDERDLSLLQSIKN